MPGHLEGAARRCAVWPSRGVALGVAAPLQLLHLPMRGAIGDASERVARRGVAQRVTECGVLPARAAWAPCREARKVMATGQIAVRGSRQVLCGALSRGEGAANCAAMGAVDFSTPMKVLRLKS